MTAKLEPTKRYELTDEKDGSYGPGDYMALRQGDEEVATDRGEPEDNTFNRDWGWVPDRLNEHVATENTLKAEIARLTGKPAAPLGPPATWPKEGIFLVEISVVDLKGVTATYKLGPLTTAWGPNGSGKSAAIRDAIQLVALGYHPTAGRGGKAAKQPTDIMMLCSGDYLEVQAGVEDNGKKRVFTRSWTRHWITRGKRKGQCEHKRLPATVVGGRKLSGPAADAEIKRTLGEPVFLDPSELMALSADKQKAKLFEFVGDGGWTPDTLLDALGEESLTEDSASVLHATWQSLGAKTGGFAVSPWDPGQGPLRLWLEANWELAHDEQLAIDAKRKDAAAVADAAHASPVPVKEMSEQKAAVGAAAKALKKTNFKHSNNVSNAELVLEAGRAAKARVLAAEKELKTVRESIEALLLKQNGGEVERLQAEISSGKSSLLSAKADSKRLQAKADEAGLGLVALSGRRTALLGTLKDTGVAALEASTLLRDASAGHNVSIAAETATCASYSKAIESLTTALDAGGYGSPRCPHCTQAISAKLVPAMQGKLDRAKERLATVKAASEEACAGLAWAASATAAADAKVAVELAGVDEELKALEKAADNLRRVQSGSALTERDLVAQQRDLHEQLLVAQAGTESAAELLSLQREEAKLMPQTEVLVQDAVDPSALLSDLAAAKAAKDEECDPLRSTLDEEKAKLQALIGRQEAYNQWFSLSAGVEVLDAQWTNMKAVAQAFGPAGLQGELLKDCLGPFTERVNLCLEGLDLGVFEVVLEDPKGNSVFWMGLLLAGVLHPLETLSGGEAVAVWPAILAGISELGQAPWRPLIVDGIEAIDNLLGRRDLFLERAKALHEKGIASQVLATGCMDTAPSVEGYTVIKTWKE